MEPIKRAPAFQLYPQDFISSLDVQMMSAAEVGAYCLLLFNSWTQTRQGYLPNDEAQLRYISRLSAEEWKQSKKKLLAKFSVTPDKKLRFNPRLVSEAEKRGQFLERQAENGRRGGRPRKDGPDTPANGILVETQNNPTLSQPLEVANPTKSSSTSISSSSSTSISSNEERSTQAATAADSGQEKKIGAESPQPANPLTDASHTRGAADVPTRKPASRFAYDPADIHPGMVLPFDTAEFRALWASYRQYREEQKLPRFNGGMQEQEALRHLSNLAADHATATAIISQTIRNGWKNLFKLDEPRPQSSTHSERGAKPTAAAATGARALAVRLAAIDEEQRQERLRERRGGLAAGAYTGQSPY